MLVVVVPGVLAYVFGYFAFRSRVKGVYFSIITQALTFAAMLLFFRNATGFGGNNGFTDFRRILDIPIAHPDAHGTVCNHWRDADRHIAARTLAGDFEIWPRARRDTRRRNTRDVLRLRHLHYKLFIWTLSAVLCGIAGALYVPQVGIINPSEMSPANSIEIAIWVAVGGRGTLAGAALGAGIVNGAKSFFTVLPRVLAVLPRPAVHSGHSLSSAGRARFDQPPKRARMTSARPLQEAPPPLRPREGCTNEQHCDAPASRGGARSQTSAASPAEGLDASHMESSFISRASASASTAFAR